MDAHLISEPGEIGTDIGQNLWADAQCTAQCGVYCGVSLDIQDQINPKKRPELPKKTIRDVILLGSNILHFIILALSRMK